MLIIWVIGCKDTNKEANNQILLEFLFEEDNCLNSKFTEFGNQFQ
jgi:hypothetical protein